MAKAVTTAAITASTAMVNTGMGTSSSWNQLVEIMPARFDLYQELALPLYYGIFCGTVNL